MAGPCFADRAVPSGRHQVSHSRRTFGMSNRGARAGWLAIPLLLLAWTSPASAQFGIRGGVNLSKFVGNDAGDESVAGLNLGASIPLINIGPLSIGPEIYYAKK